MTTDRMQEIREVMAKADPTLDDISLIGQMRQDLKWEKKQLAEKTVAAIYEMEARGISYTDIAFFLRISKGRVSQLAKENRDK